MKNDRRDLREREKRERERFYGRESGLSDLEREIESDLTLNTIEETRDEREREILK